MYGGVQEMYTLLCCCISVFFRSFVGRSFVRSLVVVAFRTIVRSFVQLFRGARCRSFFVVVRRSLFVVASFVWRIFAVVHTAAVAAVCRCG